jgi:hypothetical protein
VTSDLIVGFLPHGIERDCSRDQNQRAVPLIQGTLQALEPAVVIREAEMNERGPHRRHVPLFQVVLRAAGVS